MKVMVLIKFLISKQSICYLEGIERNLPIATEIVAQLHI